MQLSRLLLLTPALLASAQFSEIVNGVTSVISEITSVGGDATSVISNIGTKVTSIGGSVATVSWSCSRCVVQADVSSGGDCCRWQHSEHDNE